MLCMKCGREIQDSQVFCEKCLSVMQAYPVKPDTVVQIPKRPARAEKKVTRAISLKEVVRQQRATIRWLVLALVVMFTVLIMVSGALFLRIYSDAGILGPGNFGYTQTGTSTTPPAG